MTKAFQPAQVFAPGDLIAEEAQERGWTAGYVAKRLGLSDAEYADLLAGKMRLNLRLSVLCGALFGVDDTFFTRMEMIYRKG